MNASSTATAVMSRRQLADGLFLIQCTCAVTLGLSQFRRMLDSVEGVSITWLGFWVAFLAVNLGLAVRAHRTHPTRISRQTIIIYLVWTLLCSANFLLLLCSASAYWNTIDSLTAAITLAGVLSAIAVARWRHLPLTDPLVHAAYAVFSKAVPQLTLAWNIWRHGGAGVSAVACIAGHVTIGMRLWQISLSIREAGWDRNRLGMAIGEAANEASWLVATAVWWYRQ